MIISQVRVLQGFVFVSSLPHPGYIPTKRKAKFHLGFSESKDATLVSYPSFPSTLAPG